MFHRFAITILATFALAGWAVAVEFIELSDANQAILNLDLSKSLKRVQDALQTGYQFNNVADAMKFVDGCHFVQSSIKNANDGDYQGLAGKIKAILAEDSVVKACGVSVDELSQYAHLDEKLGEFSYLSKKKFDQIVTTRDQLEQHSDIKLLLSHLFETKVADITEKLLAGAANDVAAFFYEAQPKGVFDFETKFKQGCAISKLAPICKLVRRSSQDNVSAIGADFKDFASAVSSKDAAKISAHEQASGVNMDELNAICSRSMKDFRPLVMVDNYKKANMLSEQRIVDAEANNQDFDVVYQMYQLCLTAQA